MRVNRVGSLIQAVSTEGELETLPKILDLWGEGVGLREVPDKQKPAS